MHCHNSCEDYKAWKQEREKIIARRAEQIAIDDAIIDSLKRTMRRIRGKRK